ncbi:MAG: thioesterase family protein [Ilumatobacteraceae bacterium]
MTASPPEPLRHADPATTFLGLELGADGAPTVLPVVPGLCTPFGRLYGGSGLAACVLSAEAATGRPIVWITTQYVDNAVPGERVELTTEVVVAGRATSQTHVHGTVDGRTVLHATAAHTDRPIGARTWWGTMPAISPPEQCTPMEIELAGRPMPYCFVNRMDRVVPPEQPALVEQGRAAVWVKLPEWPIGSAASQGFAADIVPMAMAMALGRPPGGTSLDNTVRIVAAEPTDDWVLLDIECEGFNRSIGIGRVRLWRRDGTLIGVGTQSCIMRTSHQTRAR